MNAIQTQCRDRLKFLKKKLGVKSQKEFRNLIREKMGTASDKSLIDRLLTFGGQIINYPDAEKGWKPFAIKAVDELLQQGNINAILSSSSPIRCHIIARELKVKYGIPWIADLRDLWSEYHKYSYSRLRLLFDRKLEIKTLSAADMLVIVSQPWAKKLGNLHSGKATCVITNGFDPKNLKLPPIDLTDKFTITFTGNLYSGNQDPTKLFSALADLISEKKIDPVDFEIRFYGPRLKWLEKKSAEYHLSDIVRQYGTVPHEVAIDKQRESQILLLLDWDNHEEKGVYPMKVFEYLAAGRPMLVTGGISGNVIDDLLTETKAGIHAVEIDDIKNALMEFYKEYKQKGRTVFQGIKEEINKYSQREMAGKFAAIMNRLVVETKEAR